MLICNLNRNGNQIGRILMAEVNSGESHRASNGNTADGTHCLKPWGYSNLRQLLIAFQRAELPQPARQLSSCNLQAYLKVGRETFERLFSGGLSSPPPKSVSEKCWGWGKSGSPHLSPSSRLFIRLLHRVLFVCKHINT